MAIKSYKDIDKDYLKKQTNRLKGILNSDKIDEKKALAIIAIMNDLHFKYHDKEVKKDKKSDDKKNKSKSGYNFNFV